MSHYTGSVPDILAKPPAWHREALCARPEYAGRHDGLWFANPGQREAITEAKRLCFLCPVRRDCLRAEMDAEGNWGKDRRHGVRGGLTGGERHALYKELQKRKKQAEPTQAAA
ncbi:WhiB family transcriptional regulator [Streptomyces sp. NPDC001221]